MVYIFIEDNANFLLNAVFVDWLGGQIFKGWIAIPSCWLGIYINSLKCMLVYVRVNQSELLGDKTREYIGLDSTPATVGLLLTCTQTVSRHEVQVTTYIPIYLVTPESLFLTD